MRFGNELYFWKIIPRSRPGPPTFRPRTRTSPVVGGYTSEKPWMRLRMVDLPQPEGPTIAMNSP